MIGYGKAQVWEDRDVTKLAREVQKKQCPKGYTWDGQKCLPPKKKTDILEDLKDVDISKVRNAELTGDNNLYSQKDAIISYGTKYMQQIQDKSDGGKYYMEFEKMKNNLRRNITMSANQKLKDDEVIKMMMEDENFMTETNMDIWKQTRNTSMFSPQWNQQLEEYTEEETTTAQNELQAKYYEDDGTGNMVLKDGMTEDDYNKELEKMNSQIASGKPIAGVGELYNLVEPEFDYNSIIKDAVSELSVDELTRIYDGKTKTSGHDMYTEKQTVANESAMNAIGGAFNGHRYGNYIQRRVQKDAEALGLSVEDYIMQQAAPHLETKLGTWYGRKPEKQTFNINTASTTPRSEGSLLRAGSTFDYSIGNKTDKDGKIITAAFTTAADGVQTSITQKSDSKKYFEMTPDREFKGQPMGFQVLKNYNIGDDPKDAFIGGYYNETSMQEFVPNAIEHYYTAPKGGFKFDGREFVGGEMIPDDVWLKMSSTLSKEDLKKTGVEPKPWLKGTTKDNKGELAFRFDGAAKAQFETWYLTISDAKDAKAGLKAMLAKAGLTPNPQKR